MPTTDPRVDAYIKKSASFAQPILAHLRAVVHATCPEVEEALKWGHPHFLHHGMLCRMAAFKEHCVFGFWKHALLFPERAGVAAEGEGGGQFGRITSVKDLPARSVLAGHIRKAMALNTGAEKAPRPASKTPRAPIPMPADFKRALAGRKKAQAFFDTLSPSHRRDYLEWITEAKTDATRQKRMDTTLEWLAEGKTRHWKYKNC